MKVWLVDRAEFFKKEFYTGYFRSLEVEKQRLIWIWPELKMKRHAQSRSERLIHCLFRYLSLPGSGQTERGHADESDRLLLQNADVQDDG